MRSLCRGSPVCVLYAFPRAVIILSVFALGAWLDVGVGVEVMLVGDVHNPVRQGNGTQATMCCQLMM